MYNTMEGGQSTQNIPLIHTYVESHLTWSFFNTFCCCFPLGIIAVIYSNKAQMCTLVGQTAAAQQASRTARNLNIACLVLGLIVLAFYIYLIVERVRNLPPFTPPQ